MHQIDVKSMLGDLQGLCLVTLAFNPSIASMLQMLLELPFPLKRSTLAPDARR